MTTQSSGWLRRHYSGRRLTLLVVFALLIAAALRGWLPFIYAPNYTPKTMTAVHAQHTTHCIGRYLIDLPSNFELSTGGWGDIELYYGLDKTFQRVYATVKPNRYTNEEFWKEVNKRRFELQGTTNIATQGPMLLLGEQIDKFKALLRRLPDEDSDSSIKTEVHVLVGDRYVTLVQESYSKSEVIAELSYINVDSAPAEDRLKMIASKLLPYKNAERAKPGFCMQGVLFDVDQDDETAPFNFYANDLPDIHITVDYHAVTGQPSQGLYERVTDGIRRMPLLGLASAVLRKGDRLLGGASAQEYLSKTTRPVTQHLFMTERRDSLSRTLDRPYFGITMSTGNEYGEGSNIHRQDNSKLSDADALGLWDDMVASVRKR